MLTSDITKLTTFHDTLNQELWDGTELRKDVQLQLLKIAKEFVKFIKVPGLKLEDVTISGSNVSYNYNDQSDIDLHLIVDGEGPCWEHLNELFLAKKNLFNDKHDIKLRGHEVELYVQDKNQPHISNGIYSIVRDAWVKKPQQITANPDKTNVQHKYNHLKHVIDSAIQSGSVQKMTRVQEKIKNYRQTGLNKHGEYGAENLAFKMLRNDGLLQSLFDAKLSAMDHELSLTESSVAEKINPEITQKHFYATKDIHLDGVGKLTLTAKNLSSGRVPEFVVNVTTEAGKNIGYFRFVVKDYDPDKRNIFGFRVKSKLDPHVIGGNVSVWTEFQKKGIATAAYQFVKELGNDIKPSTMQTDAGKSMWRSFDRQSEVAESQALNELNVVQTLKFIQQAHGDQLYGELPYWHHPRAVAMTGKRIFGTSFSSDAAKVAFLHDVVEDTQVSLADLGSLDFSPEVIEAVGLLTKNKTLTYAQNIEQIINSGNRLAMMVKYADNYENYSGDKSSWDPNRAASMEKRYRKSMNMLAAKLGVNAHVDENFADGKGPGRPGDSQRHGIPKGATMAELEKASHAKGRKGQLARWQMNMRRGHKKEESIIDEKWSQKYKRSIDCSHPKGFSQKAHCAGKKKTNESISGEDMLKLFHQTHHAAGENPEMEKWMQDHEWGIKMIHPDSLPDIDDEVYFDDPFNRVMDIDTDHVRDVIRNISRGGRIDPIIMGPGKSIIDGNHRAQAAKKLRTTIQAYVPMEQIKEFHQGRPHIKIINEPFKDPVAVLKKNLDKMKAPNWDKIDLLMKRIANRQGIGADLLHKMWVDKYKRTPDTYCGIKKKVDSKD